MALYVAKISGGGVRQVTPTGTLFSSPGVQAHPSCGGAISDPGSQGCFQPSWSPDGKKIVFSRGTSSDNDSNIYAVNADGTHLTQVTHGGRDQAPDWGTHPLVR
jgi:hypothetical protein